MQWKRLCRIPELHSQAEELGKFACTKPLKHSWSKVIEILLDEFCEMLVVDFSQIHNAQ